MDKIKQQLQKKQLHRKYFFAVLAILICAACVKAVIVSPKERAHLAQGNIMSDELWQRSYIEAEAGNYNEYRCIIPDNIIGDVALGVKGYQVSIKVFLNQEQIYQFQDEHKVKGAGWKWVDLPNHINGEELLVQVQWYSDSQDIPSAKNIYFGGKNAIFIKVLQENLYALIIGGSLAIIGLGVFMFSYALKGRIAENICRGIYHLGIFVLLAGVWIITDSCFMQLFMEHIALITLVSFLSFMAMPYFFLEMYSDIILREKRSIKILRKLYMINLAVSMVLYLLGLAPLQYDLYILHILIIVTIVIVLKNTISEVRRYERAEMKVLGVGMLCFGAFIIAALVFAYLYWNWLYAIMVGIGALSLIVSFAIVAVKRLHRYLFRSTEIEEYQKKAYTDHMTGMKNRTAFLEYKQKGVWRGEKTCVVLDINNLKAVNDNFGHNEGDKLIVEAADCIRDAVGTSGTCYRIGGDEFVVILPTRRAEDVEQLLQQLDAGLAKRNAERDIPIKIASGYSVQKEKAASFDEWFDNADYNMYLHKRQMKAEKKADLR